MAQLKDLIVNGNARIITDLNVNGYETVDETVKVGRDPTANLEVATKQYVDNHTVPEELFVCTTSTTYNDVTAAIAAGKIPVLYDGSSGLVAFLSGGDDGDVIPYYTFSGQIGTYGITAFVTYKLLNTDVWQPCDSYYVSPASIDDTSTNNQIPTALAVYNALQNAGTSVIIREWSDS